MPARKKYTTEEQRIAARRAAVRKCDAKPENRIKKRAREKLRVQTSAQKLRRKEMDKIRNAKSEVKAKKNSQVRERLRKKAAAEGRVVQKWRLTDEERPEAKRKYWHNWKNSHPEGYKKHIKESNVRNNTRRARKLGNGGKHTIEDVRNLSALQNGLCAWCYKDFGSEKTHVDHWIPLAKGGTNDKNNLRLLHQKCNLRKGTKDPRELDLAA